jgi:hypothetical protein
MRKTNDFKNEDGVPRTQSSRRPSFVDTYNRCYDIYGSKTNGDGKCDIKLSIKGDMDLNATEIYNIVNRNPSYEIKDSESSASDTFVFKIEGNGVSSCIELLKCLDSQNF